MVGGADLGVGAAVEGDGGRAAGQLGAVDLAGPLERGRHREADLDGGAALGVQHLLGVVDDLERPGRLQPPPAQLRQDQVHPGADGRRDLPEVGGGPGRGHRLGRQLPHGHLVRHDILPVQEPFEEREHAPLLGQACLQPFPVQVQALGRQARRRRRPAAPRSPPAASPPTAGCGWPRPGWPGPAGSSGSRRTGRRTPAAAARARRSGAAPSPTAGSPGEAPDRQQVVHVASLLFADQPRRSPDRRVKRPVRRAGGAGGGGPHGSRRWGRRAGCRPRPRGGRPGARGPGRRGRTG